MAEYFKLRFGATTLALFLLINPLFLYSQTTLERGDVAVLGMNANANCPAYGYANEI